MPRETRRSRSRDWTSRPAWRRRSTKGAPSPLAGQSVIARLHERAGTTSCPLLLRDEESAADLTPVVRPNELCEMPKQAAAAAIASSARSPAVGLAWWLKGQDVDLGRDVALKVLREEHAGQRRHDPALRRGGADRRPAPAPRHRAGLRARPAARTSARYFAMKLVKGETLRGTVARTRAQSPASDRRRASRSSSPSARRWPTRTRAA